MDWRRLERWANVASIALYVAAVVSLVIMLGESLLPTDSPVQRAVSDTANYLQRLGDIGGGTIIIVVLMILAGGGSYMLFFKAYDKYQENKQRREQERAVWRSEAIAEGRAEGRVEGRAEGRVEGRALGRVEGRAEGRAEILDELRDLGINVDGLLPDKGPNLDRTETE